MSTTGASFIIPVGVKLDETTVKSMMGQLESKISSEYAHLASLLLEYNRASEQNKKNLEVDIQVSKSRIELYNKELDALRRNTTALGEYAKFTRENANITRAWGLIMQDLAFGFVAIQNNIPALISAYDNLKRKQLELGEITQAQFRRFQAIVSAYNMIQAPLTILMITNPKLMSEAFQKLNEVLSGTSEKLSKLRQFEAKRLLGEDTAGEIKKIRDEIASLNVELARLRGLDVSKSQKDAMAFVDERRQELTVPSEFSQFGAYLFNVLGLAMGRGNVYSRQQRRFAKKNVELFERAVQEFLRKDLQDESVQEQLKNFARTGSMTAKEGDGGFRRGLNTLFYDLPFLGAAGLNENELKDLTTAIETKRKALFDKELEQAKILAQAKREELSIEKEKDAIRRIGMESYPAKLEAIRAERRERAAQLSIELDILKAQMQAAKNIGDNKLADEILTRALQKSKEIYTILDREKAEISEVVKDRQLELLGRRQGLENQAFSLERTIKKGALDGFEGRAFDLETKSLSIALERKHVEERIQMLISMGRRDEAEKLNIEREQLRVKEASLAIDIRLYELEREREMKRTLRKAESELYNQAELEVDIEAQQDIFRLRTKQSNILAKKRGRALSQSEQNELRSLKRQELLARRRQITGRLEIESARYKGAMMNITSLQSEMERAKEDKKPILEQEIEQEMGRLSEIQGRMSPLIAELSRVDEQLNQTGNNVETFTNRTLSLFEQFSEQSASIIGQGIGKRLEMMISGEEALFRKELELSERRLAMQRKQYAKQERELNRAYRRQTATIDELLSTQQITESEALRRRAEANKEFQEQMEALQIQREELAMREMELERRRSQTLAKQILMNVSNLAVEMVAQWGLNMVRSSGLNWVAQLAAIIGIASLAGTIQGALRGLIVQGDGSGSGSGVGGGGGSLAFGGSSAMVGAGSENGNMNGSGITPSRSEISPPTVIRETIIVQTEVTLKGRDVNLVGEAQERKENSLSA